MKTILAFGDSLTWGANPGAGTRHDFNDRWPSVLEAGLGGVARVVAEGMPGRTTVFDDPAAPVDRNGARILPMLLASHSPIDLLIILLGSNDLRPTICGIAASVAAGVGRLVDLTREHPYRSSERVPDILIVAPPVFRSTSQPDGQPARGRSILESQTLVRSLHDLAAAKGCAFFDPAGHAKTSTIDGVHLDAANTRALGEALVPLVHPLL
jgi:lysophospholipase L1-like esterase